MADISWPAALPQTFTAESYSETWPDNIIATDMDVGFRKVRKRNSSSPMNISGNMIMDLNEYEGLKLFYKEITGYGALRFNFDGWECRFTQPPSITYIGPENIQVSLQLEYLKELRPVQPTIMQTTIDTVKTVTSNLGIRDAVKSTFKTINKDLHDTFIQGQNLLKIVNEYIQNQLNQVTVKKPDIKQKPKGNVLDQILTNMGLNKIVDEGFLQSFIGKNGVITNFIEETTGVQTNLYDTLNTLFTEAGIDVNGFTSNIREQIGRSLKDTIPFSQIYTDLINTTTQFFKPLAGVVEQMGSDVMKTFDGILGQIVNAFKGSYRSGTIFDNIFNTAFNFFFSVVRALFPTLNAPSQYFAKEVNI